MNTNLYARLLCTKILLFFSIPCFAQSTSFTYEGRLYSASGVPLLESVDVKFQILNPAGNCVLYEEVQSGVDLSSSKGAFSLSVGSGVGDSKRSANFRGAFNPSMISVFRNSATLSGIPAPGCAAGTYVAGASDTRLLRVQVTKGSTTETLSPDLVINTVPSAQVANSLQGFLPSDFLRLDVTNGISGNIGLTATGTGAGQTREFRFYELAANGVEYSALKAPDAMATSLTYVLPSSAPAAGDVLKATVPSSGVVTLSWGADAGAGGGISNFNGSNQSSQSFTAVDIAAVVTAPAWSTNIGTGAHTLQIPMAVGAGVTGGLITKAEHTAFSSKVDRAGDTMSGNLAMGTNKITGVGDPTNAQEAATKAYVDSQDSGKLSGTLTATRIPYASGASTLTDSAGLAWDNASSRLDITGGGIKLDRTGNGSYVWFHRDATSVGQIRSYLTPVPHLSVTNPSGATEYLSIDTSSGRVGIGTAQPNALLEVSEGSNDSYTGSSVVQAVPKSTAQIFNGFSTDGNVAALNFLVRNSATLNQFAYVGAVSVAGGANYAPALVMGTSTATNSFTERLRIDNIGRVGIGTNSPGALLQIGTAGTSLGTMRLTGDTSGFVQIQPAAAAGSWNLTLPPDDGNSGDVLRTDGSGVTTWVAPSGGISGLTAGRVPFATSATTLGNDANLFWDNTNKRLGIGSSSPTYSLHVTPTSGSTAGQTALIQDATATTGATTLIVRAGAGQPGSNLTVWQNNSGTALASISQNGDFVGTNSVVAPTVLSTNNYSALNSLGVAIGGTGSILGFTNASQYYATVDTALSRIAAGTLAVGTGAHGNSAGTLIAGAIGIGTASPEDKLHISGGVNTGLLMNNTNAIQFKDVSGTARTALAYDSGNNLIVRNAGDTGDSYLGVGSAANLNGDTYFQTRGVSRMTINQDGNVGIGTTSPEANLHVKDYAYVGNDTNAISLSSFYPSIQLSVISNRTATPNAAGMAFQRSNQSINSMGNFNNDFVFSAAVGGYKFRTGQNDYTNTSGTDLLTILSSGNVGIGTTSPAARLDVAGQIRGASFAASGTTIDWNSGNTQSLAGPGTDTTLTLNNFLDGGSYTLAIQGGAAATYSFTATGVTAWKFSPSNAPTVASKDTIYSIVRIGATAYVSWISDF